jgi:hypothetical protein
MDDDETETLLERMPQKQITFIEYFMEDVPVKPAKSGFWLTTANIVKSHVGLSSLAIPYGFVICGY